MRKFSIFLFGLFLLSGAFVFQSDAQVWNCNGTVDKKSYYRSQGCCLDIKRPIRTYSNRIGPYRYRPNTKSCTNCIIRITHPTQRKDVTYYKQYSISPISYRRRIQLQRKTDYKHYPRYANTVASNKNAVRNNDYIIKKGTSAKDVSIADSEQLIKSSEYAWAIPAGFVKNKDGIYRKSNSSLAFRVVSAGKCNSISFTSCVHNVSANFKETQSLSMLQDYRKVYRWNQVVHTDFSHFPTITESFKATVYGRENSYYIFNALNPENGNIIRIEMVEATSKWNSVEIAFEAFETFRLKF